MNHKKKILYLLTQTHYGGAQKYVHDLALTLRQAQGDKYNIIVAVGEGSQEPWMTDLTQAGTEVLRLKHVKRNLSIWHDFLSGFELYSLYKKIKPDVVHLNNSKIGAIGAVIAALYNFSVRVSQRTSQRQSAITKVIYTVHGLVLNEPLPLWRKLYYWLAEWIGAWFKDVLICVSEHDKQAVLKWQIAKAKKIKVIHNGIDLESTNFLSKEEAREKLLSESGIKHQGSDIIIGTIAGLYKTKGLQYLIKAVHLLGTRYALHVTCLIIGSGPEEKNLKSLIKKYKLEEKIFIINISENAAIYLKAFDIFVLPSVKEGLAYTLIEARAAKLPILATKVGGNPEVISDNKTGVLVSPANPELLAKELANLIKYENLREKLSNDANINLIEFSLTNMIHKTKEVY
jgi:glycosyltransferase involved in cell wall biosynthesis